MSPLSPKGTKRIKRPLSDFFKLRRRFWSSSSSSLLPVLSEFVERILCTGRFYKDMIFREWRFHFNLLRFRPAEMFKIAGIYFDSSLGEK